MASGNSVGIDNGNQINIWVFPEATSRKFPIKAEHEVMTRAGGERGGLGTLRLSKRKDP